MEGFAANQINHGVKSVRGKVASLLLRRMHPSLLGEEWCANNNVLLPSAALQSDTSLDELAEHIADEDA